MRLIKIGLVILALSLNYAYSKNFISVGKKKIDSKKWITGTQKTTINLMCKKKSHYNKCYTIGALNCRMRMKVAFKACSKNYSIPRRDISLAGGKKILMKRSICAGRLFHKKNKKFYKKDQACKS